MLQQVILSVYRQAIRHPILSLLNLLGLALGISVCALILIYARTEMNFNNWVANQDRLYLIEGQFLAASNGGYFSYTFMPLKPVLDAEFAEVAQSARMGGNNLPVKHGDFSEYERVSRVDPEIISLFGLQFVAGQPDQAFDNASSIVISESIAAKYFGESDPIGETLTLRGDRDYTVTGVIADLPGHSDLQLDILVNIETEDLQWRESWSNIDVLTFVRLAETATVAGVEEKLAQLVDRERPFIGDEEGDMREIFHLFLQPFSDIHLGSAGRTATNPIGNYAMVYGFIAIAILILLVSAFNYVSLANARALEREKEICLRKVMGAGRKRIAHLVLGEAIITTLLAAFFGLLITVEALPYFGQLVTQDLFAADLLQPGPVLAMVAGATCLGIFAGIYPALFVAGYRPARFLGGGKARRAGLAKLRTAIVFLQFTVAIGLVIGAVAISRQMNHINNFDMGYVPDGMLFLRLDPRDQNRTRSDVLKREVAALSEVTAVTRSSIVPTDTNTSIEGFYTPALGRENAASLRSIAVDVDFFDTYRTTLLAGRGLNDSFANDRINVVPRSEDPEPIAYVPNIVVNRAAVSDLGFDSPEAIIGETIIMQLENEGQQAFTVVGVVENMYFRSFRFGPGNHFYFYNPAMLNTLSFRTRQTERSSVTGAVERLWRREYPETPLRLHDLEERIANQYRNETKQLQLFTVFSGLTILLSCVGLIGLVLNSVAHRTKEICLRRVVGASVRDVIRLFTWQYLKPVLIANIPAWALAWYFLSDWLEKYTERISLGLDLYVVGGGAIMLLTLVLVAILVVRSALTPPGNALRYE